MQIPLDPYSQAIWLLLLAAGLQISTTICVATHFRRMKGQRLLWAVWVSAMLLMINERISALELTFISGIYDYTGSAHKLAISLLLLAFAVYFGPFMRECQPAPKPIEPQDASDKPMERS